MFVLPLMTEYGLWLTATRKKKKVLFHTYRNRTININRKGMDGTTNVTKIHLKLLTILYLIIKPHFFLLLFGNSTKNVYLCTAHL